MPGKALLVELLHERIGVEFFDVEHAGATPFAREEHHGANHGRDACGIADSLHSGFEIRVVVAAVVVYVICEGLGGMLTNFKTIQTRIATLKKYETMEEDGTFDVLPKKEVIQIKKEMEKLQKNLGGIKDMKEIPDMIFVVDPKKERICVQEAHALGITLIGIGDTNCDPEELDYIIPGNDDAIRAVKLIVSKMADAVIEANQGAAEEAAQAEAEESAQADAE